MGVIKYDIGNKVRIKSIDWYNKHKDIRGNICMGIETFVPEMSQYCGNTLTIRLVDEKHKFYLVKECVYAWTDEMIEGLAEDIEITQDVKTFSEGYNQGYEDGQYDVNEWVLPEGYQFVDDNDNIINTQKIVLKKKKIKYPKTYDECCNVLGIQSDWHLTLELDNPAPIELCVNKEFDYVYKLEAFRKLYICRDAYWKLAGKENKGNIEYVICNMGGEIISTNIPNSVYNHILNFPSAEIRDTFKENFDSDIEFCKEFL